MIRLHPDWRAFFEVLLAHEVELLLVGGLAIGFHADPRATDDLAVFVRPGTKNARRLKAALEDFGFGAVLPSLKELAAKDRVLFLGRKPFRIDILTGIDGVVFEVAWRRRILAEVEHLTIPVIGREDLIANKAAAGRPKDIADLALLAAHTPRAKKRSSKTTRGGGRR